MAIFAIGHGSGIALRQCSSSDVSSGVILGREPPAECCCLVASELVSEEHCASREDHRDRLGLQFVLCGGRMGMCVTYSRRAPRQ